MATYSVTAESYKNPFGKEYTFTGGSAATALADQTDWIDISDADEVVVTAQVVKAGTTDTATMALEGTIDDGTTVFSLPDVSNTPLNGTVTSASTAATHDLQVGYNFGASYYGAPKPTKIRVAFSTSGTTDNKNITNGTIITRKHV